MQDQLYSMLMQKDEITWQSLLHELIRTGKLDPWNIDISILAQRYLDAIRTLQEANFFISGKVVLAAAILLKIKSDKLLTEKLAAFDQQLFSQGEIENMEEFGEMPENARLLAGNPQLTIKTPLARKKKVNLNDLMGALQKALEVDQRRTMKRVREEGYLKQVKLPEKKVDISILIKNLYDKILGFFKEKEKLTFNELIPSDKKEDKIMTFLPLLHLVNSKKIDIDQKEHFGEIEIIRL
ncbi:MAG: segregation/condensation protein A [Candidatus Nanoarchaeia archaeon]|nr:segregation/condensation protein A [Candidatus Nanoarchaeia archaeon]MDD5588279.1 segregation/condensation protein A [Candidatus Nanoarchaeia archaeon]